MYFDKEMEAIKKYNRYRKRFIFDKKIIDCASNDYLGLSKNKKIFKKAISKVLKYKQISPKASMLVNGYTKIHKKFEKLLCTYNNFEDAVIVGSGFLANVSLIESMIRKNDILFMDEQYHASGILSTRLSSGQIIIFKHNDPIDLLQKISSVSSKANRKVIAIEGIYSMTGDMAPKSISTIANNFNALLIVDEAHSCGVIGNKLLGWFDYNNLKIRPNYIKMGTLSKAYGSYGAYILGSRETIDFLINRSKPIIYSTALSLIDTALGHEACKYIAKNHKKIINKIIKKKSIVENKLKIQVDGSIVSIIVNNNKKVLNIQKKLQKNGFLVGAIRQPTVEKSLIRFIIKLDVSNKKIGDMVNFLLNKCINSAA